MIHGVARIDKADGTDERDYLVSVYVTEQNGIDNGCFAVLGSLRSTANRLHREIYNSVKPSADSSIDNLVLIASPEVDSSLLEYGIDAHQNLHTSVARGYKICNGDIFSITKEAIDGEIKVGNIVELQGDYKLKSTDENTSGSTVVGKLVGIEKYPGHQFCVIEINPDAIPSEEGGGSNLVGSAIVGSSQAG